MAVTSAVQQSKSVADPTPAYVSMQPIWKKNRAVLGGERFVKDFDTMIDTIFFANLLIPFSPSMTQQQYDFYKAEAELPGITSQYAKMIVGGLLRKQPQLELPADCPKEAHRWIMNEFGQDNSPLTSFLDTSLWEEVNTSRAWVYVDYPSITEIQKDNMSKEDYIKLKPYPILWSAESVVNYSISINPENGTQMLSRVIVRNYEESFGDNEFHPKYLDTVWVHELDTSGYYQLRKFQKPTEDANVIVINGKIQKDYTAISASSGNSSANGAGGFTLVDTITNLESNGERIRIIPAWPLGGSYAIIEPILTPLIDREVALYNKISRRNHLLYGAATYTPVICSNMSDEEFLEAVSSGLGTWLKLQPGDTATMLPTPTDALVDMDRAIASSIEEMAKMGIRMLSPDSAQSGVALEIRNAAQTAQMGTFNIKVSNVMSDIIAYMLNIRYDKSYKASDVKFTLSADFNPTPLGADWLRLVTEWYETGKIPRSLWLQIVKQNDLVSPDYDDEEGQGEINNTDIPGSKPSKADVSAILEE